jgi:hypothetical protein
MEDHIMKGLYRYIFRGIGIAFLIGVLTLIYLWVGQFRQLAKAKTQLPVHQQQTTGAKP